MYGFNDFDGQPDKVFRYCWICDKYISRLLTCFDINEHLILVEMYGTNLLQYGTALSVIEWAFGKEFAGISNG